MCRTATLLAIALPLVLPLAAQAQPAADEIGTWRLVCAADRMTDRTACTLLHDRPVEPSEPGRPALALEIMERGGRMVPAVTARDLTLEGAARGLLALTGAAQLRFPPNRLFEMPCGLEGRSLVCAPRAEDLPRAEAELPAADRVLVRVQGLGIGGGGAEPVELRLSGTAGAIARYRQQVPPGSGGSAPPEAPGLDGRELLGRIMRFLGL
jgi:hypothetical protein